MIIPYGELITKIMEYSDYNMDEDELKIKH